MNKTLYLAAEMLRGDPGALHHVLVEHTDSVAVADRIRVGIETAARQGELSHCLVVPDAGADAPYGGWRIEPVHAHRGSGNVAATSEASRADESATPAGDGSR